jgi:branched-chain amino acid transport system substrate-binding protein
MRMLASLGLALAFAATQARAADPIRIGEINPFSGPLAKYGLEVARGHELAVDEINAAGGLLGRQVELTRGDATNPQQAIASATQLAGKVDLLAGTYMSPVAATASDTALQYGKLYWETVATAQELTDRDLPNFLRTGPNATSFAIVAAKATADIVAPGFHKPQAALKVWIEHEDMSFGTSVAATLRDLLAKQGIKPAGYSAHSFKAVDLNDTVLRIQPARPDLLIEIGYVPDGNLLLRNLADQGVKIPAVMYLVTGDAPETLQAVGAPALENVLVVSYPRTNLPEKFSPGGATYLKAYQAKYNAPPASTVGMTAYAGFQMLFDAVRAAGSTDPAAVRAAAAKMDKPLGSYIGGYGVKFDQHFQNQLALPVVIQWQSGEPITIYPPEAAAPGATYHTTPGQ